MDTGTVIWVDEHFLANAEETYEPEPLDAAPGKNASGGQPNVELLAHLDEAQRAAVSTSSTKTLIVAGPGAGKTRVLTRRIAWLTGAMDVAPRNVMAITFTNKAAAEMRERVESQIGAAVLADAWIGTFHSICARLLRRGGPEIGIPSNFAVADADDTRRILKRIVVGDGVGGREATKIADELARTISSAKNRLEDPAAHKDPSVARYAAAYRDSLAKQHLVDFDDLLTGAVRLLNHPEVGPRIRARFTHVLVDEYQDTNVAQWQLLRTLIGSDGSIYAVGDAQQSIYGFRGSTPAAMEQFLNDWPGSQLYQLGRNWRSTAHIVAVGDAFGAETGVVNRANLWTTADQGAPVRVVTYRDDRDEARAVATEVARAGTPWTERAVLVRTHATTRLIEAELAAAGVPYDVVGGTRFWDRAEVRDALAWIRLAVNPNDRDAFQRAATAPRRGLGEKATATALAAADAAGLDIIEWIRREGAAVPRFGKSLEMFLDTLDAVTDAAKLGPGPAVAAVLDISGFIDAACRSAGRADTADDREANLDELLSAANMFVPEDPDVIDGAPPAGRGTLLTEAFCAQAALSSSSESDGNGVRLSTVHAAKGQEFADVWVIGVEDGLFPHARARTRDETNEECRLLFVAATRAKERLTLTWTKSRMVSGKPEDRYRSPFLDLLTPLERVGAVVADRTAEPAASRRQGSGQQWGRHNYATNRSPSHTARRPTSQRDTRTETVPGGGLLRPPAEPPQHHPVPQGGYQPGQHVRHDTFGDGLVTAVSGDAVTVRFGQRTRSLAAGVAPMHLVE